MHHSLDPWPPSEGGKAWYRLFAHVQYYPKNLVIVYLRIFSVNYTVNYSYTRVG